MKYSRKILIALSLMLIVLSMASVSCEQKEPEKDSRKGLKEKITNKTEAYMTDFLDSRSVLTTNKKISVYLLNWAESKGIRAKEEDGIIVMNVDGSEKYKDVEPTVILCPFDEADFDGFVNPLITTLYVLKNNEQTGRLTALFYPEHGHDLASLSKLKKEYFKKGSKVFCLNGNAHANISQTTGGASHYEFTKKLEITKPVNQKAYRINISGIRPAQIDNKINNKINPIMEANTLLASLKKSSIDYEIASFRGGGSMLCPSSCSLVITVDEDRQALFEKRIQSRIESFDKRKQIEDPDAVYEYRETGIPGKAVSMEDSAKLVSFVYTLLEDEYYRDEDTDILVAVCDVSSILVRGGSAEITSTAYSIDEEKLAEIDDAEETLCGLSGFKYKKIRSIPGWSADPENGFPDMVMDAYNRYTGKTLKIQPTVTPCAAGYVTGLTDKCDILSVTVSENTMTDLTGMLMEYLIGSNEKE